MELKMRVRGHTRVGALPWLTASTRLTRIM